MMIQESGPLFDTKMYPLIKPLCSCSCPWRSHRDSKKDLYCFLNEEAASSSSRLFTNRPLNYITVLLYASNIDGAVRNCFLLPDHCYKLCNDECVKEADVTK